MFKQNTTLVWIGILALSGMFLMGQEAWGPDDPGDFQLIPAALLSLGAAETVVYVGRNPNITLPQDMTLTFHGDGTFEKDWALPVPLGAHVSTGTWAYDGMELTLDTSSAGGLDYTEVYGVAFTYNDGEKLELRGAIQDVPGDGSTVEGSYSASRFVHLIYSVLADFTADSKVALTVDADLNWEEVTTTDWVNDPLHDPPDWTEIEPATGGPAPNELYDLGDGTYIIQLEDTYVLTRQ